MKRLLLTVLLTLLLAAPASAHITVIPDVARPGDTAEFTFRVPNERDDASTVGVDLFLPPGVPARIAPHAGWTSTDKGKGQISFAANDNSAAILPGRTQDFKIVLGPLPKTDRIAIKALQHYADGQIVRWIQTQSPDDERPAAFLDLSGKGASAAGAGGSSPVGWIALAVILLVLAGTAVLLVRRRT